MSAQVRNLLLCCFIDSPKIVPALLMPGKA